jgi:hypothetical protein
MGDLKMRGFMPWVVASLFLLGGCSSGEPESTTLLVPEGPPRYARRALPFDPKWKQESTRIIKKPKSTGMVIWEVSGFDPEVKPTPEQRAASAKLIESCYESAQRHGWFNLKKGLADGFWLPSSDPYHFRNTEFITDGAVLDPDRPEVLMYYKTPQGRQLAGFMFIAESRYARGPQIAGPLSIWHYHVWRGKQCVVDQVNPIGIFPAGVKCPEGIGYSRSFEMMHVWLMDRPGGPFATAMAIPKDIFAAGLEKRMKERGF